MCNRTMYWVVLAMTTSFQLLAQEKPEAIDDFTKMRNKDFTHLIGGIQEGAKTIYNKDKSAIEGSGGGEIKKWKVFVVGGGSVGTTTNLSSLFAQDVLPTFDANLSINKLLGGTWFYAPTFSKDYSSLAGNQKGVRSIQTSEPGFKEKFKYKENLRTRVRDEKIKITDSLYTHKRFVWVTLNTKYDRSKYLFYDAQRTYNDQLYEPHYQAWNIKGEINGYLFWNKTDVRWISGIKWRPNFIYLKLAVQYGRSNNISQLKKTTVSDITSSYGNNGTTTRQIIKNSSAYEGVFSQFNSLQPNFEFIFAPFQLVAFNAFGEYNLLKESDKKTLGLRNYGSIATGIYFYGRGESSTINIGAYYKWTQSSALGTSEIIKQIGLKTSIPVRVL